MTFLAMAALAFIRNDAPVYFWLGLLGLAVGSVTIQFAESTTSRSSIRWLRRDKVGRVSGLGWSAGYFGGIVLLLICYFGFVSGDGGALGLSTEGGFNMRMVALLAAIWFGVSALPVLFRVPEITPSGGAVNGVVDSYKELFRTLRDLWQVDRNAVYFLSPPPYSATDCPRCLVWCRARRIRLWAFAWRRPHLRRYRQRRRCTGCGDRRAYRRPCGPQGHHRHLSHHAHGDGHCDVFCFGRHGLLDLRARPVPMRARRRLRPVASSPARCLRIREGEMFGLYATTGRAVSWLTPLLFGLFVSWLGQGDRGGVLAIGLVLLVGALILIPVRDPHKGNKPFGLRSEPLGRP